MGPCLLPIRYIFLSKFPATALAAILVVRVAATTLVVSSRNSAGLVTPVMFFGALGGALTAAALGVPMETMAIAGIAASLAAVFNAPLSAIFIVVEMTHLNYTGPITIAAYVSYILARNHNILVYSGYRSLENWQEWGRR